MKATQIIIFQNSSLISYSFLNSLHLECKDKKNNFDETYKIYLEYQNLRIYIKYLYYSNLILDIFKYDYRDFLSSIT